MKKYNPEIILAKKKRLEEAKTILNQEFIGLTAIINTIIDSLSSWYLFPEIQEKPIIINLWGLTGVGKSSLVNRLSELIGFHNKYFRFDLGMSHDKNWEVKGKLEDIFENENGIPIIIGLDEFQHAKSKNEKGEEIANATGRIVWDLLDSGKFNINRSVSAIDRTYNLIKKLKFMLHSGVKVDKGMVVENQEKFIDFMNIGYSYRTPSGEKVYDYSELYFVNPDHCDDLFRLAPEIFNSEYEIRDMLTTLNGQQSMDLLSKVMEIGMSPRVVDCSKSLIFVMGNLDEVYSMSQDFNPDISADEFHNQSLKINISNVKQALKERFRNEQIARLGNIHIIYPAFSQNSFLKLIELELGKISARYRKSLQINIEFDNSIIDLIYQEGVYPTQGTRPLFTTINFIVGSKIGKVYFEINMNEIDADKVLFRAEGNVLFIDFFKNDVVVNSLSEVLDLNLDKLRKNTKDDLQAITAVHESGHAVVSMALLNTVPEYVYSVTADADSHGFMYARNDIKYVSKKMIIKKVAMLLGGLAAEKLIFGDENITTGADDDLRKATGFVMNMIKTCGMGNVMAHVNIEQGFNNLTLFDPNYRTNIEGERILKAGFELATKTLAGEKQLLLQMADHLCDNRLIKKDEIRSMVKVHSPRITASLETAGTSSLFYRKHLKQLVSSQGKSNDSGIALPVLTEGGFTLNRDNRKEE